MKHKPTTMIRLFNISRQAFYKQLRQFRDELSAKTKIVGMVLEERKLHPRMGSLKLYGLLKLQIISASISCGRDKFISILREEGLLVKKKRNFTRTTNSNHRFHKYANLIKDIVINGPEQVYVSDITYIRVGGKFMYLSLVTDAYSKRIMGFHLSVDMKVSSVIQALQMAIDNSKTTEGIIHHSDRGLQYCHPDYSGLAESKGMKMSMTIKHDPYENAIAERVNGILKGEYNIDEEFPDATTTHREVSQAIWKYNNLRPHMSCYMLTPVEAHQQRYYKLRSWSKKRKKKEESMPFSSPGSPMAFSGRTTRAGKGINDQPANE